VGVAESGSVVGIAGWIPIVLNWNRISLLSADEEVILHETLHTMGFGHNGNSNSMMNPYTRGYAQIDSDIVEFIKQNYVRNPFAYLNILTLNMLYGGLLLYAMIFKTN
jgi:hypothetical protein